MSKAVPRGLLVEFDTPEALVEAVKAARGAGIEGLDGFTPFPVEGLPEALGFGERRIPLIGLLGGIAGGAIGYGLQVVANLDYPLDIGGRPLLPPQAFGMITFELTVLGAVLAMIAAFFILCRLPRLHHPLFDIQRFEHATVDGFFLLVPVAEGRRDEIEALLVGRDPRSIVEVAA